MTDAEYFRAKKALLVQWAYFCQDENARRLLGGIKLNKKTGRDGGRMKGLSKFQLKLKAFRGQPQQIGFQTGALSRALQDRRNVIVTKTGKGFSCDVEVQGELLQRLRTFESGQKWVPTKKEANHLTKLSAEMGESVQFSHNNPLVQPARPFFGHSRKADDWVKKELEALWLKFVNERLTEMMRKVRRKR